MANNNNIFNAALAGASSGISSRWLTNTSSSSYASQAALIVAFATAFDDAIAPVVGGGSRGQASAISDICTAFCGGRILTADMDMAETVAPLVALYSQLSSSILPDSGGGGGGSTPLLVQVQQLIDSTAPDSSNTYTIDIATPTDLGTRTIVNLTGAAQLSPSLIPSTEAFGDTGLALSWSWDGGLTFQDDPFTQFISFLTSPGGETTGQFNYAIAWAPTADTIIDVVQLKMQFFNFGVSTVPVGGVALVQAIFTDAP